MTCFAKEFDHLLIVLWESGSGEERTAGVWDLRCLGLSGHFTSGVWGYLLGPFNLLRRDIIRNNTASSCGWTDLICNISWNCNWCRVIARQECSPGRYVSGGWIWEWVGVWEVIRWGGWCVGGAQVIRWEGSRRCHPICVHPGAGIGHPCHLAVMCQRYISHTKKEHNPISWVGNLWGNVKQLINFIWWWWLPFITWFIC